MNEVWLLVVLTVFAAGNTTKVEYELPSLEACQRAMQDTKPTRVEGHHHQHIYCVKERV